MIEEKSVFGSVLVSGDEWNNFMDRQRFTCSADLRFLSVVQLHCFHNGAAAFVRRIFIITAARIRHFPRCKKGGGLASAGVNKNIHTCREGYIQSQKRYGQNFFH